MWQMAQEGLDVPTLASLAEREPRLLYEVLSKAEDVNFALRRGKLSSPHKLSSLHKLCSPPAGVPLLASFPQKASRQNAGCDPRGESPADGFGSSVVQGR